MFRLELLKQNDRLSVVIFTLPECQNNEYGTHIIFLWI